MSPITRAEAKELVEQIDASSDEQVQSLLDLAVQNRDLDMIIVIFTIAKNQPRKNMAVEALKQLGSESFDDVLDRFEKADHNFVKFDLLDMLVCIGKPAVYRIITRLEHCSHGDPNRKHLAYALTKITGKSFTFGNSNPDKWWKYWRENIA
jgi:hypothetical protein